MNETIKTLLPMLRRFAYSLTGSKADADDVVQITIEKLLVKGIPDDVEPAKWAFKICRNVWIDEYRSRKVRQNTAQADVLPEEQRAIVSLVAVQGMAYKEVAHTLDIPIGSVMSKLSRARSTLYNLIKPDFKKEQV